MSSYRERLQRELGRMRSVVDDFEAAIRVEALMNGTGETAQKVLELKADAPKKTSARITIRKVTGPEKPERSRSNPERDRYRESVLAYIDKRGPTRTSELMEHLGIAESTKETKQVLYQVMYDLKRLGTLVRGDDMVYSLADPETNSVPQNPIISRGG